MCSFCLFCNNGCLIVCLCVNSFFSSKFSQEPLDFGKKFGNDKLYCERENQPYIAYQSVYLSILLSP